MIKALHHVLVAVLLSSTLSLFSQDFITFYADNITVSPGERACMDIKVRGFKNVDILEFQLEVDSDIFSNLSYSSSLDNNLALFSPEDTKLIVIWGLYGHGSETVLEDGATFFSLCFDVNGVDGTTASIQLNNPNRFTEGLNTNLRVLPTYFLNPIITINSNTEVINDFHIDDISIINYECAVSGNENYIEITGGVPPYHYEWIGHEGFHSTDPVIYPPRSGRYILTATDQEWSELTGYFYISGFNGFPSESRIQHPSCASPYGSIYIRDENFRNIDYLWSTGDTGRYIRDVASGDYAVTMTNPFTDCVKILNFSLQAQPKWELTEYCYYSEGEAHGKVYFNGLCGLTPPLTLEWNTGETHTVDGLKDSLVLVNPPNDSDYSAIITDANGVTFETYQINIHYHSYDDFDIISSTQMRHCLHDTSSITLEVFPKGNPYSFIWNTGDTGNQISELEDGQDYEVTVTNTNTGVSEIRSFTYEDNYDVKISLEHECGEENSAINVSTWDGTPEFLTYSWSTGEEIISDAYQYNLPITENGTYSVTVSNSNGCENAASIDILCGRDLFLDIIPSSPTPRVGDEVYFNLEVSAFDGVASMQFTLKWNKNNLTFIGLDSIAIPGVSDSNFTLNQEEGSLFFAWEAEEGTSLSLADKTSLFTPRFKTKKAGLSEIRIVKDFNPSPSVPIIFIEDDGLEMVFHNDFCQIYINPLEEEAGTLEISTEYGHQGDEVCLEVKGDLEQMLGMQFSLTWDPSQLEYLALETDSTAVTGLTQSSFGSIPAITNAGHLNLSWVHPTLQGVSLSDDLLFKVCFKVISPGGFRKVSIESAPTPIELINSDDIAVWPTITNGGIWSEEALVWPGDTDNNGVVNNHDLLNIGLGYGNTGAERPDGTSEWVGQSAPDWDTATPQSLVNFRFSDTNGDGLIATSDKDAIEQNWAETTEFWSGTSNGFLPPASAGLTSTNALFVDPYDIQVGQSPVFDISLSGVNLVQNAYGIAFTIVYDPLPVVPGSLNITFADSWLGTEWNDFITIYHDNPISGRIDIAITRIDRTPINGLGAIAQLQFQVADIGNTNDYQMYFNVENIRAISHMEEDLLVIGLSSYATIEGVVRTDNLIQNFEVSIFPNPTENEINVNVKGAEIEQIDLLDIRGRFITSSNLNQLPTNTIVPGLYYLKIRTDKGTVFNRFVKI